MSDQDLKRQDDADSEDEGARVHRRGFFRQGFRKLFEPIADLAEQRISEFKTWEDNPPSSGGEYGAGAYGGGAYGAGAVPAEPSSSGATLLRPPGALPELEFLARCVSSGSCVAACPVSAIKLVADPEPERANKPMIEPESQACVVCEDLSCMKACPTGALQSVRAEEIDMGLAEVDVHLCVRSQGEDCQICVDKCPLGPLAIDIPDYGGEVEVKVEGCTGCGVCQMYCPTEPRAIVVRPRTD